MFGPPWGVTPTSSCPCVVHVVSRLPPPTVKRPFRTRFRYGCAAERLNQADDGKSPDHYAKGTPSPGGCPHWAPTACRQVVSGSLSSPDRGSSHRSLALLDSLSVASEYLALGDGPPRFRPTFTCSVLLRYRRSTVGCTRTGLSPPGVAHSRAFRVATWCYVCRPYNPTRTSPGGLGWSAFARRY